MNEITRFISSEVTEALGWTLLHSLWQGGAIVLLLSVLMTVFRRWSPQVRYLLGLMGLLTLLAAAVATFCRYYPASFAEVNGNAGFVAVDGQAVRIFPAGTAEPDGLVLPGEWSAYLQPYLPLIVATWMIGLLVFMLRLLGQWTLVYRLRYSRSRPVADYWQDRLRELAVQMGIRRVVQLRESLRINTPMVIGIIKPVVLVPVGLLAQLSPDQVESALVHELAHIRRHDYLVNLLQALVEALFFFNPAVWWLSSLVRVEREHCCDDWAVNVVGDEVALVEALASLEEYRSRHVGLAIGLNGSRGSVLGRIRRLLYGEPRLQLPYRLVGGTLVVLTITIMVAFGQPAEPPDFADQFDGLMEEPLYEEESDPDLEELAFAEEEMNLDTVPPELNEAVKRLEAEYRARFEELEKRMQEFQRRQLEKQSTIMAMEDEMAKQHLSVEKQRNQLERQRLEKEKNLEIRRNQLRGQVLEKEKALRQLERSLEEEGMKDTPNDGRLRQLQEQLEKMNQEQRALERQNLQIEGEFQQIQLDLQQLERELASKQSLSEKDRQLQRNDLEREMLEWQEQMQQLQQEQRRLQYEFQLKLEELHAAQREKSEN